MGDAMKKHDAFDELLRAVARAPSVRPADLDLTGRTVGRFVVERRLGEGGMGVVYEAFDPVLARKVALKVLRVGLRGSAATRARLHEEARRVAALHHPHIAAVYDAGEHEGIVFLALERAAGRSLRARLAAPPALTVAKATSVLRAIASGLAGAHEAGIIHRDLKPENVVVGDDGTVKLVDFGIATPSGSAGRPAGTRRYMAPEQIEGAPATPRVDVFAFGVLAREVLSATAVEPHEKAARAALGRVASACAALAPSSRPRDGAAVLAAIDAIAAPSRGLARPGALTFGVAAVAAALGVLVARSSQERPARAPVAAVSRPRAASHASDDVAPSGPALPAPRPVLLPEPATRDADGTDGRGAADDPGRAGSEMVELADGAPWRLPRAPGADPAQSALPVKASVDGRGQLVATVGLGGVARSGASALPPMGALDAATAQAQVIPDGNGGAVIRVTLHVRPPIVDSGSGTASGHHFEPGTLPTSDVSAGGGGGGDDGATPDKPLVARPTPDKNPPADPGADKQEDGPSAGAAPAVGATVVLCAHSVPGDVRATPGEDGEIVLTARGPDGDTVLAILDADGEVLELGAGATLCSGAAEADGA
jgi:hypothetical protein